MKIHTEGFRGRQREVLTRLANGENVKSIGAALGISNKTVEYHKAEGVARIRALAGSAKDEMETVPLIVHFCISRGWVTCKFTERPC